VEIARKVRMIQQTDPGGTGGAVDRIRRMRNSLCHIISAPKILKMNSALSRQDILLLDAIERSGTEILNIVEQYEESLSN
jgi:hypothetical protein